MSQKRSVTLFTNAPTMSVQPGAIIDQANFAAMNPGGYDAAGLLAAVGPGWFFTDATASAVNTIQTSPTALLASAGSLATFGTNIARVGSQYDDQRRGIYVEQASTNITPISGMYTTGDGATLTPGQTDPAGGTGATRVVVANGHDAAAGGPFGTVNGQVYFFSAWQRQGVGLGGYGWYAATSAKAGTASASWARNYQWAASPFESPTPSNGLAHICLPVTGRALNDMSAGDRDLVQFGVQYESASGPTSLIVASSAATTRAAGILGNSRLAPLIHAGRLSLEIVFSPFWSLDRYLSNVVLWYVDANNNVEVLVPSGQVVATVGGVSMTLGSLLGDWLPGQQIDLEIDSGGGVMNTVGWYRVAPANSDTWSQAYLLGETTGPQPNWTQSGSLHIGGDGTSATLNAVVSSVTVYQ